MKQFYEMSDYVSQLFPQTYRTFDGEINTNYLQFIMFQKWHKNFKLIFEVLLFFKILIIFFNDGN